MGAQILHLNRYAAKYEPESWFGSPDDLVNEVGLTLGEKLATLERWSSLVQRRLSSIDEGMTQDTAEPDDSEL